MIACSAPPTRRRTRRAAASSTISTLNRWWCSKAAAPSRRWPMPSRKHASSLSAKAISVPTSRTASRARRSSIAPSLCATPGHLDMALSIYTTLSKSKDAFTPLVGNQVRMYVCGMTVYDFCHIGHARVMVAFDVVTRWLRHRGYDVTYVRNITDIDDKIIRRAQENGEPFEVLVERMIAAMHEDEARLSVLRPDIEPRATQHIDGMFTTIKTLIDKRYAYAPGNGDVYYRVGRFAGYGKLSRKRIEDLKIGARIEVGEAKEDPLDFVLWKAAKPGEPSWASPWGEGRPGWHIECSVMSTCCLGDTFDIHGGGPDLVFPHHENEIAQSEAATGKPYAMTWMHAGAVRVDGEKMSKSLGNFFTIRDVLEQYHPEVVRYLLVASHYRSPINYSEDNLKEAKG